MYFCGCDRLIDCMKGKVYTSSFLRINANQSQVFPQRLQKVVQVQLHPTAEICRWAKKRVDHDELMQTYRKNRDGYYSQTHSDI